MKNIHRAIVSIAFLLGLAQSSYAYQTITNDCNSNVSSAWQPGTLTDIYYSSPASMADYTLRYNSVTDAWSKMNRNPSSMVFSGTLRFGSNPVQGNIHNDFYFSDDTNLVGSGGARTVTSWWTANCTKAESDVRISMLGSWQYSADKTASTTFGYGGSKRNMVATVLHELGHFMGLQHENRYYNIMGVDWTHVNRTVNSSTGVRESNAYLGEDAANGMVFLYGSSSDTTKQDLSVSHWYHPDGAQVTQGTQAPYSYHRRIPLANSAGTALSCITQSGSSTCQGEYWEGDQFYNVTRGQSVRLSFNFENNGRDTKTASVRYYLSTDDVITTADTLLLTTSYPLTRDLPDFKSASVTIPSTLTVGQRYYLGAIVDYNNAIVEKDETNNTAYTGILVN